jgi:beta-phosphoglucomutase
MHFKAIILDFDGVIAESVDIKTGAFTYLFRNYPDDIVKKIVKFHLDNGGLSRFEKFKIIYRGFLNKDLSKEEEERLGMEFGEFCYKEMLVCPYVKGAKEFLEKNYKKYMFFIVSGTPHDEMNNIVDARQLRKYFKEVLGTPGDKCKLIKMILKKYNLMPTEVAFIGDAPTDYKGAEKAHVEFIARVAPGKYNPFESNAYNIKYQIKDLISLEKTLSKINYKQKK